MHLPGVARGLCWRNVALELLATLLATGNEDDYLVALDICEQEQVAMPVSPMPHCWARCCSHWMGASMAHVPDPHESREASEYDMDERSTVGRWRAYGYVNGRSISRLGHF